MARENIFDVIGDFFAKMLKGIVVFVFCKFPVKLWKIISDIEQLKNILRYLASIVRAIILCVIWVAIVFLGWWVFLREKFVAFWKMVWEAMHGLFLHTFNFIKGNAGWLWMILAISGSIYGLLYVTLKRRAERDGKEFLGVFGWLRRKKGSNKESESGRAERGLPNPPSP